MSTQRQRPVRVIPDALDPQQTVEIEKRWLPRGGVLAILAGLLPLIGIILEIGVSRDRPDDAGQVVSVADAITRYAAGDQGQGLHGIQAGVAAVYGDHAASLIGSALLNGLGALLLAPLLYGLLRSAYRRRPSFPTWFQWLPVVGAVVFGIGGTAALVYDAIQRQDFSNLPIAAQTNTAATDALNASRDDLTGLVLLGSFGQMFVAVGIGAAALSAMNVGLLTRVMGIVGVMIAVFTVLPIVQGAPFLRSFWLVALGLILLGRWPGGRPPAWDGGVPRPWPTRAQQIEAAERAREAKASAAAAESQPAPTPKSSGSRKKRRK
ncbi:hypothetical protein PAI11_03950 [Patulibacter medicamentivorans]|uniref:Uncharacterized protein n=1 Tax=Patulibacter medicamentivorans TaxID=1097667 RepID=H0E0T7_9ACTN|nr:hypothetical protein [Patulibacter medicamentivorans]EHN12701.1 hypothetical protein PAI11_03950 [Patulibacter medicamentivorans]